MNSEILNDVTAWESRPFTGGYAGLRDLADRGFTGAVSEGAAWAFVLNGRVVGVFDGTIEDFEGADGTCYEAPDPALPLLGGRAALVQGVRLQRRSPAAVGAAQRLRVDHPPR